VAFNAHGNPVGRSIEKRNNQSRYWYVGLGCSVLVSTTYLLRALLEAPRSREVRLFEGLASFKPQGQKSLHSNDVLKLRKLVWDQRPELGQIVAAEALAISRQDLVVSAFSVAGMDFGVPPVVVLD
jgi:hypothetical protein